MMRQPPMYVPRAIELAAAASLTQTGISMLSLSRLPCAISASVMMPIVFWVLLVPWASETSDAEAQLAELEAAARRVPGPRPGAHPVDQEGGQDGDGAGQDRRDDGAGIRTSENRPSVLTASPPL